MTKDTLGDLNGYLFERIEALNNPDLQNEELDKEIKKTKIINEVAKNIIANANVVLNATKFQDDRMDINNDKPKMLEG